MKWLFVLLWLVEPDRINLVILDECHHCAKEHPYREIMRLLLHHEGTAGTRSKPRILGLSASVINIKLKFRELPPEERILKLESAIRELEECLGCIVVTSLDGSLREYGARPDPIVVQYLVGPFFL